MDKSSNFKITWFHSNSKGKKKKSRTTLITFQYRGSPVIKMARKCITADLQVMLFDIKKLMLIIDLVFKENQRN